MGDLSGVKSGDQLLLTGKNHSKQRQQEPRTVTVHKVGTKLVHVLRYGDDPNGATDTYRIDTGRINDAFGHEELWKPEDWEAEKSRAGLEAALRLHGVEVRRGGPKPIPVLEKLLAVLEGEL